MVFERTTIYSSHTPYSICFRIAVTTSSLQKHKLHGPAVDGSLDSSSGLPFRSAPRMRIQKFIMQGIKRQRCWLAF